MRKWREPEDSSAYDLRSKALTTCVREGGSFDETAARLHSTQADARPEEHVPLGQRHRGRPEFSDQGGYVFAEETFAGMPRVATAKILEDVPATRSKGWRRSWLAAWSGLDESWPRMAKDWRPRD